MTEHGVSQKLKEIDNFRPDNNILPSEKARKGVERMAAALTLGKSLTLRTPAQGADPELTAGALDPALILGDDWTSAERNALLRRGIFVPSTYGRVRFHHRSTQEYLAGKWLERIRREGCPLPAIWNLLFAEPHGVKTVAPSLRSAAAWLALNDTSLADEIIRREPLMLLQYGDPGSLPLETRKRLLRLYAEKHARGEIANDALDQRALWMFAHAALADTIRGVWHLNPRPEFRDALLHLIREGAITGCVDLARAVAHDEDAEDYERIVALQALHRCHDQEGLAHAARQLMASASQASPRLASGFARILFPEMLGVEEILTLIADSLPAQQHSVAGFPYIVDELYERCPDTVSRSRFISGIADLCLAPPFANRHERISERYGTLTEHLVPIARHAIQEWKDREPPPHLVRLLMAIERGERDTGRGDSPPLAQLVQKHARLNWALFWADVEEARCHGDHQGGVTTWWHAQLIDQLWELDSTALSWLLEDLSGRPLVDDQRVALSAIIRIFVKEDRLQVEASRLRKLVAGRQELEEDLENCFAPRQPDEALMRSEREYERAKHRRRDNEEKAKASWVAFRGKLLENPSHLRSPAFVGTLEGLNNLHNLTNWLRHRMRKEKNERTAPHWQHLSEGFSLAVAEAYRDGMKALWRITRPERPQRREGGHSTVKWSTVLSYAGVAIEAKESSDWAGCLTAEEAVLAARHSCMAEQDYPEWMDALIQAHPTAVLPVLRQALRMEWRSTQERPLFFFYHYASAGEPLLPAVQRELLEVILGKEPEKPDRLERGIKILQRLDLDAKDCRRVVRIVRRRMRQHAEAGRDNEVLCYLACLLFFDFARGLADFAGWLEAAADQERQRRAETAFGVLFGRDAYVTSLAHASVEGLEQLLRLTYRHIRPENDRKHEGGGYTPDERDEAESARNTILVSLLDRSGEEAYHALLRLSEEEDFRSRGIRYKELAKGIAERDAERPPWSTTEVIMFEREHTTPIKSGADLFRVAEGVLDEIRHNFLHEDASSRHVLATAEDEPAVQKWLAEQLRYLRRGRFHVHRENEVADRKEPDITLSSATTPPCEVAIEVKRADSWTIQELEKALCKQLAENYLRPASRRHGILVATYHGKKGHWIHPRTRARLSFLDLIAHLEEQASALERNSAGNISVRVVGINAASGLKGQTKE
jgi:hypothetical protein